MILPIILLIVIVFTPLIIFIYFHNYKHNPELKDKKHAVSRFKDWVKQVLDNVEINLNQEKKFKKDVNYNNKYYSYYNGDVSKTKESYDRLRKVMDGKIKNLDGSMKSVDDAMDMLDDVMENMDTIFDGLGDSMDDMFSSRRKRKPKNKI